MTHLLIALWSGKALLVGSAASYILYFAQGSSKQYFESKGKVILPALKSQLDTSQIWTQNRTATLDQARSPS